MAGDAKQLKVLVAEDDLVSRKIVTRFLEQKGRSVVAVKNGAEAVVEHAKGPFDVAIMDVNMPELGGYEAAEKMREQEKSAPGARRMPIIIMSAQEQDGSGAQGCASGIDLVLLKPMKGDELNDAVDRVCASSTGPQPGVAMEKAATASTRKAFDLDEAVSINGDLDAVKELAELFDEVGAEYVGAIEQARAGRDLIGVGRAAHKLKGALKTIAAGPSAESAAKLEKLGSAGSGDWSAVDDECVALKREMAILLDELKNFTSK